MKLLAFFFLFTMVARAESSLNKALTKYSKAKTIQAEIQKTDEKIVLGTKSESSGELKFQKDKIFISQNGEKKVEFYYNNKVLTLVEYPDKDFDPKGNRKVTTIKKSIPPLVTSIVNLFSNPKAFATEFQVDKEKTEMGVSTVQLKSKMKNVKDLQLKIDVEKNEIVELQYTDDVQTKTTIKFMNLKLNGKLSRKDFQFTKLKTDELMVE